MIFARIAPIILIFLLCFKSFASPIDWIYQTDRPSIQIEFSPFWDLTGNIKITKFHKVIDARLFSQYQFQKRAGNYWETFSKHKGTPIGDPRWILQLLGSEAGLALGFSMPAQDRLNVPGAELFNYHLDQLNSNLGELDKVQIRFYQTSEKKLKVRDYLENYVDRFQLPIADAGFYMVHDISFHLIAVLLPPKYLEISRAYAEYALKFIRYLERTQPRFAKKYELEIERFLEQVARQVDFGIGNFTSSLIGLIQNPETYDLQRVQFNFYEIFFSGLTPERAIWNIFIGTYQGYFFEYNDTDLVELARLDQRLRSEDRDRFYVELLNHYNEFKQQVQPEISLAALPTRSQLWGDVLSRKAAVIKALSSDPCKVALSSELKD